MTKTICSDEEQKEEEKVVVSVLISPKDDDRGHVFELELAPEKQEIVEPEPNNVVQAKEDTGIVAAAAITTRKILLLEKMPTTPSVTTTVVVATTSVETIMPKCTTTTTSKQQQHSQPQPPPPPNHFLGRTSWMRKWRRLPPPRTTATDPRQPKYRPDRLHSHCRMEMAENGLGASSASYFFFSRTTPKVNPEKHVHHGTTGGTTTTTTMSRKPKLQAVIIPGMKSIGRGISVVDPVPRRLPRSRSWRGSQQSLQNSSSNDKNNHDDRTHPRHQGGREIVPTTTRRSCLARNHGREKSIFSPSSPFVAAKRVRFLSTPFIQEFETESADTTTTTTTATDENDDDDEEEEDDEDDDDDDDEEEEDNLPLEHLGPPDWQDESSSGVVIQVEDEEDEEEIGTTTFIKRRQEQTTLVFDEQGGGGGRGNNDTYAIVPMGHDHALLVAAEHDGERGEEGEEEDTIMFNHHQDMLPRNRSSPTLAASYVATVGMGPDESSCDLVEVEEVEEKQVAAANAAVTRSFCGIMTAATTAATTVSTAHSWNFMDCATIGPCYTFTNYSSS